MECETKNSVGDLLKCAEEEIGRIEWKGIGEEAIRKMGSDELVAYTSLLEKTVLAIHSHFYYFSPHIDPERKTASFESIGFDGNVWSVALAVLQASLRMYEVHATPFVPVQVPKNAKGIAKIHKKA